MSNTPREKPLDDSLVMVGIVFIAKETDRQRIGAVGAAHYGVRKTKHVKLTVYIFVVIFERGRGKQQYTFDPLTIPGAVVPVSVLVSQRKTEDTVPGADFRTKAVFKVVRLIDD
jgi:hypothetical protein